MVQQKESSMQPTNTWNAWEITYEKYNETKKDRTSIHLFNRDLWTRTCDNLTRLGKIFRNACRRILNLN